MKRKTMALILALSMCLSLLSACGSGDKVTDDKPPESENAVSSTEQPKEREKPEESEEPKEEEPEESAEPTEPEASTEQEPAVPAEMTYTFDTATGTLTCSGGGEVVRDDWMDVVKNMLFETDEYKAKAEIKKVVVERGVTSLGERAFSWCENLTEVVLPDTLISIGESAFEYTPLTGIAIPESVTELGARVFEYCQNLASVNLPSGLTEVPRYLFISCKSLTGIEIPTGVTRIGDGAFLGTGLTELVIPEGVTTIGSEFIHGTSVTNLTIPASLTEWSNDSFRSESLTDITILCEATMDNVTTLVFELLKNPVTIHAPAGSVIEGYVNRQIQSGNAQCTFEPIN